MKKTQIDLSNISPICNVGQAPFLYEAVKNLAEHLFGVNNVTELPNNALGISPNSRVSSIVPPITISPLHRVIRVYDDVNYGLHALELTDLLSKTTDIKFILDKRVDRHMDYFFDN